MTRLTWILYLIGSALVFGSWLGVVDAGIAWIGWLIATGIALSSWMRRPQAEARRVPRGQAAPKSASTFSAEEEAAARREVDGED